MDLPIALYTPSGDVPIDYIDDFALRPYPFQIVGADFIYNVKQCMLADEMGLGKEHPVDTLVCTPTGWAPISSLQVGDYVIGSDGMPTKVIGIYPQGIKPIYRVTLSDGSSVEAGLQHLWTVRYRVGNTWATLTVTTAQLMTLPKVRAADGTLLDLSRTALYCPMLTGPIRFNRVALPVDPYTVGRYLALIAMVPDDTALATLPDYPELTRLRTLCLGLGPTSPFIPQIYLEASVQDRVDLLQGLLDTGGLISSRRSDVCFFTLFESLANSVQALVENLGGSASVTSRGRRYRVSMYFPSWLMPFRTPARLSRYVPVRPYRVFQSVQYVRMAEAVCIAVEAPDKLYVTEHCILTHNTVQATYAIWRLYRDARIKKSLIVCPASLKYQWEAELYKFLTDRITPVVIDGPPRKRAILYEDIRQRSPLFTIINYELARIDIDTLLELDFDFVVLDEAHRISSWESKTSAVLRRLNAPYKVCMTGTPLQNCPDEIFSIFAFINPAILGRWSDFCKKFICFGVKYGRPRMVVGYRNLAALNQELSPYIMRRLKKDVAPQLPEIVVNDYRVQMTPQQAALHTRISNDLYELMRKPRPTPDSDVLDASDPYEDRMHAMFSLLQEVCDSPDLLSMSDAGLARRYAIDYTERAPKLVELEQIIRDLVRAGHSKIAIFTEFARFQALVLQVTEKFGASVILNGSVPSKDRQALLDRFRNDSQVMFFVSTDAGNYGLNLEVASALINMDLPWNPAVWAQRVARIHRLTSTHASVTIINLLAHDGVDDRIRRVLYKKQEYADLVVERSDKERDTVSKLTYGVMRKLIRKYNS